MAVIKIVPMPGAVGDKGDEGAPGPQGQQGPAGQNGLPGTPALWSYQGAYNPAAAYAVGDVVVYQGQLYYTKSVTTAGTLPTNTTKFDLIAAKGADGTNGTNGADGAPGAAFGIYYLGNYNPNSGYVPDIAVVRGSDGQLYLAKASGQLGDPVGNTAQWEVWIPKGADGTNGTNGADGADALWNFTGPWVNGVDYGPGSLVEFEGSTYYHPNGQFSSYAPPNYGWLLVAAKGADGGLTYWGGTGNPGTPTNPGIAILNGIATPLGGGLLLSASDKITINANNGEFINDATVPANQIATLGDLTTPTSGTWDTKFKELNGIVDRQPSPYGTWPTTGKYYTVGDLVFYEFDILVMSPETWGTSTSWRIELPFKISQLNAYSLSRQIGQGSIYMRADEPPFYQLDQNEPVVPFEEGEVISLPVYLRSSWYEGETQTSPTAFLSVNLPHTTPIGTAIQAFWTMGHNFPQSLNEGLVDENPSLPTYVRFTVNGTYRKA